MNFRPLTFALALLVLPAFAATIGTNIPALPLSAERVANSPEWKAYLENSTRLRLADQAGLHAELRAAGLKESITPPRSAAPKATPLDRPAIWYGSSEARQIAARVASFQTPAGGWAKHTDFGQHLRAQGEAFAGDSNSRFLIKNDFDAPADVKWSYVGTIDNGATTTELRFIAKVITAGDTNAALKNAFTRGLQYLFAAQNPHGGWPQVWPLQGGYHDAITFNDNAMLNVVTLLRDVAGGADEFQFISSKWRTQAELSWQRGLECLLATQIITNGQRTVWGQQHDALALKPTSARNYEMAAAASGESAGITLFLMELSTPNSNVVTAVHAAAAWFTRTEIDGKAFRSVGGKGRQLVAAPGAKPTWARYYEIGSDKPIFGDRDLSIHDDVSDISPERTKGYGWYQGNGEKVLKVYAKWAKLHPLGQK